MLPLKISLAEIQCHAAIGVTLPSALFFKFGREGGWSLAISCHPIRRANRGVKGLDRMAASTSQMGRFETEWLTTDSNLAALSDLSGVWIDRATKVTIVG